MKKHLSRGQFWGLAIFFVTLVLAVTAFFVNARIALGIIAVNVWLSICYATILIHPLLKRLNKNSEPQKTKS